MGEHPETPRPTPRPPWRAMTAVALAGAGALAAGALLGQDWLAFPAGLLLALAPFGLVLPVIQRQHRRSSDNGYRDMGYLGGLLAIMGFDAAERDAALTRRQRAGGEADVAPQQQD